MKLIFLIIFALTHLLVNTTKSQDNSTLQQDEQNNQNLETTSFPVKDTIPETRNYLTKSPTMAIFWSLVFPGGGQIYTESYWKAPIFATAVGILTYNAFQNHRIFKDLESQNNLNKEVYRNNRDISIFFICGVYILSAIDAYVGAHLYDFDVSDDLSLNVSSDKNHILSLNIILKLR